MRHLLTPRTFYNGGAYCNVDNYAIISGVCLPWQSSHFVTLNRWPSRNPSLESSRPQGLLSSASGCHPARTHTHTGSYSGTDIVPLVASWVKTPPCPKNCPKCVCVAVNPPNSPFTEQTGLAVSKVSQLSTWLRGWRCDPMDSSIVWRLLAPLMYSICVWLCHLELLDL